MFFQMKKILSLVTIILFLFSATNLHAENSATSSTYNSIQIKIALAYNFAQFVTWPGDKTIENINVCVDVQTDIYPQIKTTLLDKLVHKRKIVIVPIQVNDAISHCHILYMPNERNVIQSYIDRIEKLPILTISEHANFIDEGGMIHIFIKQNKFRFEINNNQAQKVNLSINSQLLNLSRKR